MHKCILRVTLTSTQAFYIKTPNEEEVEDGGRMVECRMHGCDENEVPTRGAQKWILGGKKVFTYRPLYHATCIDTQLAREAEKL